MTTNQETADDRTGLTTVVSSASLVLVGTLLGSSSKLVEQVIIARLLSKNAAGQVAILISVMSLGLTLGLVGCDQGVPRFMSRFDNDRDVRGVWLSGLFVSGVVTLVVTVILLLRIQWVINTFLDGSAPRALVVLFIVSIPFIVGLELGVGAIRGFENTIYRTYSRDLLYNGLRLALLVVLLIAGVGVLAAGYAYIVASVAGVIAVYAFLSRLIPLRGEFTLCSRKLFWFSLPLLFSSGVTRLLSEIDTFMLGAYLNSPRVAAYSNAYTLAMGLGVIFSMFGFIYLPLTSRLDSTGEYGEINRVHKLTAKWTVLIAFPIFLAFVAFPTDIIGVIFGERWAVPDAGLALALVSCGFFLSGVAGYCQTALSGLGYTRSILAVNVIAAAANIALNLVLIPTLGIVGAAAASAVSFTTLNWVALAFLWYTTRISPFSRYTIRMFVLLPVVLFPPTFLLARMISLTLVTIPVFGIVAAVASVVLVAVTGCLEPEDEIPIELIEDRLGIHVPFVRRYIPDE